MDRLEIDFAKLCVDTGVVRVVGFNPFRHSLRASLDALAASDPSVTREAQGGRRHGVSGDRAVQRDHTALS